MKKHNRRSTITALELRSRAGRGPSERGSALLIVIGTLALVAVFAAVYVSIGRTDRRAAQAFRTDLEQRETSLRAGEYLAGVIGSDRLDAFVQYDVNGDPIARREVTDVTYTDWSLRSEAQIGNDAEEALLFTPTGRPFRMDGLGPDTDFRVPSDPWLAATTPTYLGDPGDPQTGTDMRQFSRALPFTYTHPNAGLYLEHRDWLQISNFAPDGRPVNLFNLRPNTSTVETDTVGPNVVGGFDAEPGFGDSPRSSDGRPIRRMSNYLSLLNVAQKDEPRSLIQAFDPIRTSTVWVPGYNDPLDIGLTPEEIRNTPAVWTMYQRFMLMPMNQPFAMLNRRGIESTWADPDYPPYQYADADGDGFADSRWFELVAARDSNEGDGNQARDDISRLFSSGDMRHFIAARAVDLSSMVNVNTATDHLVAPTTEYPIGSSPAEVSLRRLLTMQDASSNYASVIQGSPPTVIPLSMSDAQRPYTGREDLAIPRVWDAAERGVDFLRQPQDYQFYQATINDSGDVRFLDSDSPSLLIGRYAYSALRRALNTGGTLGNSYVGFNQENGYSENIPTRLVQYDTDPTLTTPTPYTEQQRYEQYLNVGQQYAVNPGLSTNSAGLFGLDDLAELLTYHGLNDPSFTSRLERAVDARYESTIAGSSEDYLQTRRMSPLGSNRDLTLDRLSHARILDAADMRVAPSLNNETVTLRIGEISRNSMAMMALTPRKRMTTLSGHVPLSPDGYLEDAAMPVALTGDSVLPNLSSLLGGSPQSTKDLFNLYSGALASELRDMQDVGGWERDPSMFEQSSYASLFYGHRGPELALRIAAHAAVNMADIVDSDTDPTIATVLFDSDQGPNDLQQYSTDYLADNDSVNPENEDEYQLYPGIIEENLFDTLGEDYASNMLDRRKAVNVYGIEASPVITEVSMLYAFTDAHTDVGGDDEFMENGGSLPIIRQTPPRPPEIVYPTRSEVAKVTIDATISPANPDYLIQVLAVQIHNPYDTAISLGGRTDAGVQIAANDPLTRRLARDGSGNVREDTIDTSTNYHFDYYLEYAGRFFKLARYIEWYPTDQNPENYFDIDDPATNPAYDSLGADNPAAGGIPRNTGGLMRVTSDPASYPDFITRNVVLQPGETRVFYAIADQRFDDPTDTAFPPIPDGNNPDDRWLRMLDAWGDLPNAFSSTSAANDIDMDQLPDGPTDRRGWTGPAEEWVNHQLRVVKNLGGRDPVMMMSFDPRDGSLLDRVNGFERLDALPTSDPYNFDMTRRDVNEVRLWKKITTHGEESNDTTNPNSTLRNLIENDLLVDRMEVVLAPDLTEANEEIEDTWVFPEDFPPAGSEFERLGVRNDNTGITISDWVTVRRPDSPTQDEPAIGQVTPWMLRARNNPGLTQVSHAGYLTGTLTPDDIFTGDVSDPETTPVARGDYEVNLTLRSHWNYARETGAKAIVQTIALEPYAKSNVEDPYPDGPSSSNEDDQANDSIGKFPPTVLAVSGAENLDPTTGLPVPEIITDAKTVRDRPRLADLLLAWGTGPAYAPDPTRSASVGVGFYDPDEWVTTGEAMAIALGVDTFSLGVPDFSAVDAVWYETWDTSMTPQRRTLEDGRLALDRFVPFINQVTGDSPIVFDPAVDRLRGAGVPLALGVIDRARVFDRPSRVTDPVANATALQAELALSGPVFGTININTAPVEVLRLLPGLAPTRTQYVNTPSSGTSVPEWWARDLGDTEIPNAEPAAGTTGLLENPDIAAGMVAYRDRMYAFPNTAASASGAGVNYFGWPLFPSVNDNQLNLQSVAKNFVTEDAFNNLAVDPMNLSKRDRRTMTGIDALRQTPGFGSLGELLAVRIDPDLQNTDPSSWANLRNLSIDMLGHDGVAQGIQEGPTGEPVTIVPQVFGQDSMNYEVGDTVDDYAEKLSLANGVLNMLSVRSDYYAVWFVVQGYRESDVANLRPEDPLIPSLHKRYIMVVDRSNVIEPGDEPNIVLLKEVPL
ncbi:MAG: hypothetical protein ACX94C_11530 [Phycisphaerales bacterium]